MAGFPNVPNVPGVPALPRLSQTIGATLTLLTRDTVNLFAGFIGPQWGIFKDGVAVIECESVLSFHYRQTWAVADYPMERGAFETYDKVETPFEARVRFTSGGSNETRQALIDSVAAIADNLELYDVVTPEVVYQNVNIQNYDYGRTSLDGVGLLKIDVGLVEIRETAVAAFSNTKTPSAAGTTNVGTVQPIAPTTAQAAQAGSVK